MKAKLFSLKAFGFLIGTFALTGAYGQSNATETQTSRVVEQHIDKVPKQQYFVQFLFDLQSQEQIKDLTFILNSNPELDIVRLDDLTNRSWITTNALTVLDETEIRSWLGSYSSAVRCIDFGRLGVDTPESYPFTNCNNK